MLDNIDSSDVAIAKAVQYIPAPCIANVLAKCDFKETASVFNGGRCGRQRGGPLEHIQARSNEVSNDSPPLPGGACIPHYQRDCDHTCHVGFNSDFEHTPLHYMQHVYLARHH
jgi:hypothetical protein